MPRTWASPRPSCPMVQLIICSATRKLMPVYASVSAGCRGQNRSEGGDDRLAWHRRPWLGFEDEWTPQNLSWYPLCPLPVFLPVSRSC
ncbi:hypothetical protein CgunFtcFv8_005292 [Champsocephalus gunnari]|uniref:Uncharacterized protein n=1 Tax=Champsocephalus gunnari TaxID=52237 RepID=A0AAN8CX56_CHAGU|nr:hypothetical protein CgunFtcFv8_005292 [Champsocephalus gunnari]